MGVSVVGGQENCSQQRSSGKRSRNGFLKNEGSAVKRRALACLSNHVDTLTDRQQLKNKRVSHLPYCSSHTHDHDTYLQVAQKKFDSERTSSVFDLPPPTTFTSLSSSFHLESPGEPVQDSVKIAIESLYVGCRRSC